jgi:hypothetical protein
LRGIASVKAVGQLSAEIPPFERRSEPLLAPKNLERLLSWTINSTVPDDDWMILL